jgi:hypothetical protein
MVRGPWRTRPLKNEAEEKFRAKMTAAGWSLTKRGWPDFLCTRDGRFIVVEVKRGTWRPRGLAQSTVLDFLTVHGIECYSWSPRGGLMRWPHGLKRTHGILEAQSIVE